MPMIRVTGGYGMSGVRATGLFFTDVDGVRVCRNHTREPLQPCFEDDGGGKCPFCRGGLLFGLFQVVKTQNDLNRLLRATVGRPKQAVEDALVKEIATQLFVNGHPLDKDVDARAVITVAVRRHIS